MRVPLRASLLTCVIGAGLAGAVVVSNAFTRRAAPPTMGEAMTRYSALSIALSGSRGILAEILWWRIDELQRQHRTAELTVLTEWLMMLEPTSPEVRAFNAWNLAYNLSVTTSDPAEKWQWVKRGIGLLQAGVALVPQSTAMKRQLAWLFEDKVAGTQDAAGPYYREHVAEVLPPEIAAHSLPALWMAYVLYGEAGDWQGQVRVARTALRVAYVPEWLPAYVTTLRAVWQTLHPDDQRAFRAAAEALLPTYPLPVLLNFLRETRYDKDNQ